MKHSFLYKNILFSIGFAIIGCSGIDSQVEDNEQLDNLIVSTLAVSTFTPFPTSTPLPYPTLSSDESLPSPLYFISTSQQDLNHNQCAYPHVIKLEQDGKTRVLQTSCFISGGVNGFDISPLDGSIVIAAFGGLWVDKNDGNGYQKVVDALPNMEGTGNVDNIRDPSWSPDGRKIAYADGGIRIIDINTGDRIDVIENKCFDMDLNSSYSRCFYGNWYFYPQWSPNSNYIIYTSQNADYFNLEQYSLTHNTINTIEGTRGVNIDNITWSQNGDYFLFDYYGMMGGDLYPIEPSFIRMEANNFEVEILWNHSNNADPVFASNANNPWQVKYPLETSDGRVLFFRAEPCTNSCYNYSLVEGKRTGGNFETKTIRQNALPDGITSLIWHSSGEYAVFLIPSNSNINWYIAVMKISTGEIYIVATEQGKTIPLPIIWGE